jgi:phosphatidylserine/phosphatidylglycerophosphate/cardiolipin synthase-like enzyme
MNLEMTDHTLPFWTNVFERAEAGVDVRITTDGFWQIATDEQSGIPDWAPFPRSDVWKTRADQRQAFLDTMKNAGVHFDIVSPKMNLLQICSTVYGCNHIKYMIFDDEVLIGGPNITDLILQKGLDCMISTNNPNVLRAVQEMRKFQLQPGGITHDYSCSYDDDNILYVDSGNGDSIIQRALLEDMNDATAVQCVSQYPPNGEFLDQWRRLHQKGSQLKLFTNNFTAHPLANMVALGMDYGITRHLPGMHYVRGRFLHAKTIIITRPDGSQIAYIGSHNITNDITHRLHTKENMPRTTDPQAIVALKGFHQTVSGMAH